MNRRRLLALSWAVLAVVVVGGLVYGTLDVDEATAEERVRSLSGQFACPQCDGQSVRDSDVGVSRQIRSEITERVERGESDDQILSFLTQAYGRESLLTPSASGAASLVWAIPVFAAIIALVGVSLAFRRWRPRPVQVTEAERELVERALSETSPPSGSGERSGSKQPDDRD